jgi:hypothetical protein
MQSAPPPGAIRPVGTQDRSQTPPEDPAKPAIDPKTGRPVLPDAQRQADIDKVDPLNRTADPTGQNDYSLTDRTLPAASPQATASAPPIPGSVAESNASPYSFLNRSGNGGETADESQNQNPGAGLGTGDYIGPAVLTRSYTLSRPMVSRQIRWKISLGYNRSIEWGQVPVAATPAAGNSSDVTPPTSLASVTTQSGAISWGIDGRHLWRHDQIGLNYQGNSSSYKSTTSLSGTNQMLNLDYSHAFSRRLSVQFVESLVTLSQNYTLENPALPPGSSVANINLATSPALQIFDSVRQSSSTASLTYQKSARTSLNLSISNFMVDRTGYNLIGSTGHQAGMDINYRLTRKTTVGAYYAYTSYRYSHDVSDSNAHGLGAIFSYAIDRRTQIRLRAGASQLETLGYAIVTLPPDLARFLGQASTVVDSYSSRWLSDISAEFVRDLQRSRSLSIAYARGLSPGNGLILASIQETMSAGYSARVLRRIPVSAGFVYSSLMATSQKNLNDYRSQTVYLSVSRDLGHGIAFNIRTDYRRFDIGGNPLLQKDTRISAGFTWSPPDNTVRF